MKKLSQGVLFLVSMIVVIGLLVSCAQSPAPSTPAPSGPKVLKIGGIAPLSGPSAMLGEQSQKAIAIYLDIINEKGLKIGNDVYKLEMVWADDQFTPQGGVAAATKLIFSDKVSFISYYIGSGNAAVAAVTNPNKVIFFARTGGGVIYDAQTQPYNVYAIPTREEMSHQVISTVKGMPSVKTVGVLVPIYNKGLAEAGLANATAKLAKFGLQAPIIDYYPQGALDYTPYLAKMNESKIDLLMCGGTPMDVINLCKQRYAMGFKYPVMQTTSIVNLKAYQSAAGEALEGLISEYCAPWEIKQTKVSQQKIELARQIQAIWEKKYNEPIKMSAYGWSLHMTSLLIDALQQSGSTDPEVVMKTIRGGTFDTFKGIFTMSGQKLYGSPVFFGSTCMTSIVKGDQEVYLGEYPLPNLDEW
jgi:branched-chain amino acid transport system substrate-binding protein